MKLCLQTCSFLVLDETNKILIRELRLSDVEELWKIHLELFPVQYPLAYIKSFLEKSTYCIVAIETDQENKKRIIAFVTIRLEWVSSFSTARKGYVSTFGVIPEKRRMKIASDLMNLMLDIMNKHYNIQTLHLHMQQSNIAAKTFYVNTGWTIVDDLKNYYHLPGQCCDAYYMVYNIPSDFVPFFKNRIEIDKSIQNKLNSGQSLSWLQSFFYNK